MVNNHFSILNLEESFHEVPNPRWRQLKMTDNWYFTQIMVGITTMHLYVTATFSIREDRIYQYFQVQAGRQI